MAATPTPRKIRSFRIRPPRAPVVPRPDPTDDDPDIPTGSAPVGTRRVYATITKDDDGTTTFKGITPPEPAEKQKVVQSEYLEDLDSYDPGAVTDLSSPQNQYRIGYERTIRLYDQPDLNPYDLTKRLGLDNDEAVTAFVDEIEEDQRKGNWDRVGANIAILNLINENLQPAAELEGRPNVAKLSEVLAPRQTIEGTSFRVDDNQAGLLLRRELEQNPDADYTWDEINAALIVTGRPQYLTNAIPADVPIQQGPLSPAVILLARSRNRQDYLGFEQSRHIDINEQKRQELNALLFYASQATGRRSTQSTGLRQILPAGPGGVVTGPQNFIAEVNENPGKYSYDDVVTALLASNIPVNESRQDRNQFYSEQLSNIAGIAENNDRIRAALESNHGKGNQILSQ